MRQAGCGVSVGKRVMPFTWQVGSRLQQLQLFGNPIENAPYTILRFSIKCVLSVAQQGHMVQSWGLDYVWYHNFPLFLSGIASGLSYLLIFVLIRSCLLFFMHFWFDVHVSLTKCVNYSVRKKYLKIHNKKKQKKYTIQFLSWQLW